MNLWRTLLLVVVALLATASPASAHVSLLSSNPEPGQALATPPQSLQLTFDDALRSAPVITVTDPNGTDWAVGRPTMDNKVVSLPLDPQQGPAGQYTIQYRATGVDSHLVVGTIQFTITASFGQPRPQPEQANERPAAQQSTPDSAGGGGSSGSGLPIGVWIFGAVILISAAAVVVTKIRRSNKSEL